jgi:hypothetical protein
MCLNRGFEQAVVLGLAQQVFSLFPLEDMVRDEEQATQSSPPPDLYRITLSPVYLTNGPLSSDKERICHTQKGPPFGRSFSTGIVRSLRQMFYLGFRGWFSVIAI